MMTPGHASDTPSSKRSQKAIAKVEPDLKAALKAKGLRFGAPVFMRIFKEESELEVWVQNGERFDLFRVYPICTYSGALGPKQKTGDEQAPEGFYYVPPSRMNPHSRFHLSFNLGYPNTYDRAHKRTGSYLMVHGNCVSIGCYAMTDEKIEEIYALADAALREGQTYFRVHAFPFRMTDANMQRHRDSDWYDFWLNLKTGYDLFEENKIPPSVDVKNKKYTFDDE